MSEATFLHVGIPASLAPLSTIISPANPFIILLALCIIYYLCLPKPIPGIPYNRMAALTPLGDIPSILRSLKHDGHDPFFHWFAKQHVKHNSPIVQVFVRLFKKPIVLVADFREAEDILTRRADEFDRAQLIREMFTGTNPHSWFIMPTDGKFKAQQRLSLQVMSVAFLRDVAVPKLYESILVLLDLWKLKASLTDKPWEAEEDVHRAIFDGMWRSIYGTNAAIIETQLHALKGMGCDLKPDTDSIMVADFSHTPVPRIYDATIAIIDSVGDVINSPAPVIHYQLLKRFTKLKACFGDRDKVVDAIYDNRVTILAESPDHEPESALDCLVLRNLESERKRSPKYSDVAIKDDLFSLMAAGLDTSATTITWCLKYLTNDAELQSRLRREIQTALHLAASSTGTQPDARAIAEANIPYLDAFIEELLRVSQPAPTLSRGATIDTQILGHRIPKGTEVFLLPNAASILSPTFAIDETLRTEGCRASKHRTGAWDPSSINAFKPERWLKVGEDGSMRFDAKAGPTLAFGLGTRGCFGKRFAYMQLRMVIVLLVLNFEFGEVPGQLGGMEAVHRMVRKPERCFVRVRML